MTKRMSATYLETLEKKLSPQTNYVKIASGEKRTLIFRGDEEHVFEVETDMNGTKVKRVRFIVTDVTDPMRPVEDRLWDISPRWARIVINHLKRNQDCLEIERIGAGLTDTQYIISQASTE